MRITDPRSDGLSATEAASRLVAEGPNALPARERRGLLGIALSVVREPMFLLLVAVTTIYLVHGDLQEALVLAASIVAVITITVTQENKAERALEALRELSSPHALVIRDGERRQIPGRDLVRGDLLLLSEGDRIPGDARLAEAEDLAVDESLLTGESLARDKRTGDSVSSGTLVVRGRGRAEVTATGPRSELGRIGASLASLEAGKTSLETETARVVRWVAALALAMAVATAATYVVMRGDLLNGVLAGLTLAMAIIPEEFPVVLTVFLALGAWRISKHGVLTRRMPAIEMLGAATVLCVDKTGTLTENLMAVVETQAPVIDVAALACEIDAFDPMEKAIVGAAGPDALRVRTDWRLERDYPFNEHFLAVCHVWRSLDGKRRISIKGAPETVLSLCGAMDRMQEVSACSEKGRRVLAVAEAAWEGEPLEDPAEYPFEFVGLLQLADPIRASVPAAVEQCRRAGIRVVMITGDYPGTAQHIALEAGIESGEVLTGVQLAGMNDAELCSAVRRVHVFARVRPEQKLRLVQAYRAAGEVVAMTGDGVNDAAALKAAHIGIAMGKRGTDVAREAASLVLLDDEFGSIVHTVRLGRRIYENIGNAMCYLVSVHVPIAGMSIVPVVLGGPLVLLPVHVVFMEFVIDPACTLVFESESTEAGTMLRPPRDPKARLFDRGMLGMSFVLGATMLLSVLVAYGWALGSSRSAETVRAITFAAIVIGNITLLFSVRSRGRSWTRIHAEPNAALRWIAAAALSAMVAALYVPAIASVFRFSSLDLKELAVAVAAGVIGVIWYEGYRLLRSTSPADRAS
jgi:Ca2+-transporting ATPase